MTLMEVLNLWDDLNVPLKLNDVRCERIVEFDHTWEFYFKKDRQSDYEYLINRKVIAFGMYDGELYIRLSDHETLTWDRLCELASKGIDGLRLDDEEQAQIYFEEDMELEPFEREFFGVDDKEE